MAETPDIYDLNFQDVYDISFEDVPVEESNLSVVDQQTKQSFNPAATTNGGTRVQECFDTEGRLETLPVRETRQIEVSEEARVLANKAIDVGLSGYFTQRGAQFSPMHARRLMSVVADEAGADTIRMRDFNQAILNDERLICLAGLYYPASAQLDPDVYWPYDHYDVDPALISELVETVHAESTTQRISQRAVMGIISAQGHDLSKDEMYELYAAVCASPLLTPLENGDFIVNREFPEVASKDSGDGQVGKIFTDGETVIIRSNVSKLLHASRVPASSMKKRKYQKLIRGKDGANISRFFYSRKQEEKTCLDPKNDPRKAQPKEIPPVDYFEKPKTSSSSAGSPKKTKRTVVTTTGKGKRKRSQGQSHGKKVNFEQTLQQTT